MRKLFSAQTAKALVQMFESLVLLSQLLGIRLYKVAQVKV